MADNVYYDMGQIRYNSSSSYLTDLNFHSYPVTTTSISGQRRYRDILLVSNNDNFEFENGEAYHLDLNIPANLSYDMVFDIKLVQATLDNNVATVANRTQYQEIRRIVVARDKKNIKTYSDVILYPVPNQEDEEHSFATAKPTACVVYPYETALVGEVYYDEVEGEYRLKETNSMQTDPTIDNYNIVSMGHTWLEEKAADLTHLDIVFAKKVPDVSFNAILIEMVREVVTDGISFFSEDNEYNGLYIPTEYLESGAAYAGEERTIDQTCNKITNLISTIDNVSKFNNIGVWSHSDSILAINGEEIRIGQSGYYELNDFEITNFGIVVKSPKDKFSLDYQYQIPE